MRTPYALLPLCALLIAAVPAQQRASERAAVERAVYDYVDALYEVDPMRIKRSVHPGLTKVGFERRDEEYHQHQMTYSELTNLAARWNARRRLDVHRAPREVIVFDVLDQTASAKLVAQWGVDYLHLAKYGGEWKIIHVLWQNPPPAPASGSRGEQP